MTRGNVIRGFVFTCCMLLVVEVTLRFFFSFTYDVPFFHSEKMFLRYYPELRPILLNEEKKHESLPRILVLGGSAAHTSFCNLDAQLNRGEGGNYSRKFIVDTLAQYAQNSLDSWYKYKLLKGLHYKYVILYHGINDTRTNNCPSEVFDIDYRHVSFYNELFIFFRHPEIKYSVIPWFTDLVCQKLLEETGWRKTIPKEYNVMEYYFRKTAAADPWWEFGNDFKSKKSFSRNFQNILELAGRKGDSVLVVSYAHFQPVDYSLEKFIEKKLGYTEHKWPTELYGSPQNVEAGIIVHNQAGKELALQFPIAKAVEFADSLPKDGKYFYDICHLSPEGCAKLGETIRASVFR